MIDILHPIDKERIKEVRGKLYVLKNEREGLISPETFVPVYFSVIGTYNVLHDTPVMGATSHGDGIVRKIGPFLSVKEAKGVIEEKKEKVDHVNYDFSESVFTLLIPEQKFNGVESIELHRYFHESCSIRGDDYLRRDLTLEQFAQLSDQAMKSVREASDNIVDGEGFLRAEIKGSLVELNTHGLKRFSYSASTLGSEGGILTALSLNMAEVWWDPWERKTRAYEYLSPLPLDLNPEKSIEDILKHADLI